MPNLPITIKRNHDPLFSPEIFRPYIRHVNSSPPSRSSSAPINPPTRAESCAHTPSYQKVGEKRKFPPPRSFHSFSERSRALTNASLFALSFLYLYIYLRIFCCSRLKTDRKGRGNSFIHLHLRKGEDFLGYHVRGRGNVCLLCAGEVERKRSNGGARVGYARDRIMV